jgi:hypothetical protein
MCDHVHSEGMPILRVCHDSDGDWQFLCGGDHSKSRPVIVCLGCAFERDPDLEQIADLPPGWAAEREELPGSWVREVLPTDDGSDDA